MNELNQYECILVCPGRGNSGDELIRLGTLEFLKSAGIQVWESDGRIEEAALSGNLDLLRDLLTSYDGLIVFPGGGNLGIYPEYDLVRTRVIEAASAASGFLIFPQSGIGVNPSYENDRVTVWARDRNTYSMLKAHRVKTDLVPDAALFLDPTIPKHPNGAGALLLRRLPGRDHEYCEYDIDLARIPVSDPTHDQPLATIIEAIQPYRSIVSDRLHGSLISLMMRKRVAFLAGSYLKSKSFYETWLENLPGIRLIENNEQLREFLDSDDSPQLDLRALFTEHAAPALTRFVIGALKTGRTILRARADESTSRAAALQNERDQLQVRLTEFSESPAWAIILRYRRWIASARERYPWIRKWYEPAALWILRRIAGRSRRDLTLRGKDEQLNREDRISTP
jgi:exopolysaccharide biosynthesis predicted pyruvyltransferase EpsI